MRSPILLALALAAGCSATPTESDRPAREGIVWMRPWLERTPGDHPLGEIARHFRDDTVDDTPVPRFHQVRVYDASNAGTRGTDLRALLLSLIGTQAVFLGETHLDDVTHQVELTLLQGLAMWTDDRVVLSLEQFERDAQPALDEYLAGRLDETEFLKRARPWGNYREAYRPLIEFCKTHKIPVMAANFPAPLRRKVGGTKEGWDSLTADERRFTPRQLFPASAAYWARVDRATGGHMAGGEPRTPEQRLHETQNLWDNAMGEAVADALDRWPDRVVLHVAGKFHIERHDGTVAQFRRRKPDVAVRTITVLPRDSMWGGPDEADLALADYVVYAAATARDAEGGRFGVSVGGELRYRLHVPPGATDAAPVPLLVWLGDDGARDDDGLAYWRLVLGDGAAVASCDPLHLVIEEDLAPGGLWSWPDTFTSDASRALRGVERLVDYVARRFPVDPAHVLVAGEGTGGTVVLWAARYSQGLRGPLLAIRPRGVGQLRMGGLPDEKPGVGRLVGVDAESGAAEWRWALDETAGLGVATDVTTVPDGDDVAVATRAQVRRLLGLPDVVRPAGERQAILLDGDSPRAERWAALVSAALAATAVDAPVIREDALADVQDTVARVWQLAIVGERAAPDGVGPPVAARWTVADCARPAAIPLAPGAFGGTTVVVVPLGADSATSEAWAALAADDPLRKRSRFHRLVVADEGTEHTLATRLAELADAGRREVLVVPAVFCAGPDAMRVLRASAGPALDRLTVHWLPGLGRHLAMLGE